ncbi:hypothetical protein J6590_044172, partial [Homalodisca vitripennis]
TASRPCDLITKAFVEPSLNVNVGTGYIGGKSQDLADCMEKLVHPFSEHRNTNCCKRPVITSTPGKNWGSRQLIFSRSGQRISLKGPNTLDPLAGYVLGVGKTFYIDLMGNQDRNE